MKRIKENATPKKILEFMERHDKDPSHKECLMAQYSPAAKMLVTEADKPQLPKEVLERDRRTLIEEINQVIERENQ